LAEGFSINSLEIISGENRMKHLALATLTGFALAGASTMAFAQNVVPPQNHPNAVVNSGSGAVNPLGPGESAGTAGIGGSATAAPRR
jgi:hypothetical protein